MKEGDCLAEGGMREEEEDKREGYDGGNEREREREGEVVWVSLVGIRK